MRNADTRCCLKWSRRVGVCFICVVLMSPKVFSLFTLFLAQKMRVTAAQLAVLFLVTCAPNGVVCEQNMVEFYHRGDIFVVREADGVNPVRCELQEVNGQLITLFR